MSEVGTGEKDTPRAGCSCDAEDAALAEVVWLDGDGADRVTCALCGATRVLPPTPTAQPTQRDQGDDA